MKNIPLISLSAVLAMLTFGCCKISETSPKSDVNKGIIIGLYDAFAKGDVPAVLGAMHENIVWMEAENFLLADNNPYVGPENIAAGVFQRIVSENENFSVTPTNYIAGGDYVAVEGRYKATHKATNVQVDSQFVHVWKLEGGKVTNFQQYTDTKQWADAAGK